MNSIFKPKILTTTSTTTTTQEFIYTEYYKKERKLVNIEKEEDDDDSKNVSDITHLVEEEVTSINEESDLVTVHRHMIFYDGKCRNCMFNVVNATLDANLLVEPTFSHSIKCHLKNRSCVFDGKCYLENEASTYYDKSSFVCDTKSKEISSHPIPLHKPCSQNNGNCDIHQKCEFDEFNNKVLCISSIHF